MTFEIHYELPGGGEDFFVLSGETVEEIREQATVELQKRDAINPWSKEV